MREGQYQHELSIRLTTLFPGAMVLKQDSQLRQGIPDLLLLYEDRWAALEVKASESAPEQPNQEYYVDLMDDMSFGAFIYPENEEDVLYALQQAFQS